MRVQYISTNQKMRNFAKHILKTRNFENMSQRNPPIDEKCTKVTPQYTYIPTQRKDILFAFLNLFKTKVLQCTSYSYI
jgi:hypothetical protein